MLYQPGRSYLTFALHTTSYTVSARFCTAPSRLQSTTATMSTKSTKTATDSSNPRQNRTDPLKPDFTPHAPVQPLGQDLLHGPGLQDHIIVILGVGPGLGISIAQSLCSTRIHHGHPIAQQAAARSVGRLPSPHCPCLSSTNPACSCQTRREALCSV